MPASMPRFNAATAALRSPRSRYQVPCPITETCGPLLPNFLVCTIASFCVAGVSPTRIEETRDRVCTPPDGVSPSSSRRRPESTTKEVGYEKRLRPQRRATT
ncbi:hypothetical protein chiPu_0031423 [Chiloscyllium punctatum]|uniref:Uncharacterized protein n=1 Tax=Chiloscyllium punctatum TaxID=137246 RepID=A0A401TWI7_CHIPU|nr:hypothetical protein [Chiloscyllium punctatum]